MTTLTALHFDKHELMSQIGIRDDIDTNPVETVQSSQCWSEKFEANCNTSHVPDNSMCGSAHVMKSDVSGREWLI